MFVTVKYEATPVARPEGDVQAAGDQYGNVKTVAAGGTTDALIGALADAMWTSGSGSVIALLKAIAYNSRPRFFSVTGTALTRPANVTPYSINDSVSDSGTAGSVTANVVALSDTNNDPITVERVRLATADTGPATAGATFEMYLFNSDPTASSGVGGGDNAAFSQKQAGFIGRLSGTFIGGTGSFSDGSVAILTPIEGSRIITTPGTGAKTVWWQIKTDTIFTPSANSTAFTPTFEGFQGRA